MTLEQPAAAGFRSPYRLFGTYRFMLAVFVFLSHGVTVAGAEGLVSLQLGNVGVMSFFVLSGFVITEALDTFYKGRPAAFLANRFLKIFPPYWTALTLTLVVLFTLKPRLRVPLDAPTLAGNYLLIGSLFRFNTEHYYISVSWAVIVEILFYGAAAALIGVVALRKIRWPAAILILVGFAYVLVTAQFNRAFSPLQHAPYFLLGIGFYYCVAASARLRTVLPATAACYALALCAYFDYSGRGDGEHVATTLIFGAFVLFIPWLARSGEQKGPVLWLDKRLGVITYAFYLVHQVYVDSFRALGLIGVQWFALAFVLSFASAELVFFVSERALYRIRDRIRGVRLYQ